jgi:hypothetical protein
MQAAMTVVPVDVPSMLLLLLFPKRTRGMVKMLSAMTVLMASRFKTSTMHFSEMDPT